MIAGSPGPVQAGSRAARHPPFPAQFQPMRVLGMRRQLAKHRNQIRVLAGGQAGIHFIERQTIARHCALEKLQRHRLRTLCRAPFGLMNDA